MATLQTKKSAIASKMSAPTPFQMIGSAVKGVGKGIQNGLNKGAQNLLAPSDRVNKIYNAKMQDMDRKAKAGEYNY